MTLSPPTNPTAPPIQRATALPSVQSVFVRKKKSFCLKAVSDVTAQGHRPYAGVGDGSDRLQNTPKVLRSLGDENGEHFRHWRAESSVSRRLADIGARKSARFGSLQKERIIV